MARADAAGDHSGVCICRVSDVLTDTQQTIQDKTKEALDQGAKVHSFMHAHQFSAWLTDVNLSSSDDKE